MKTTIELPEELYRRAKAVAALRGTRLKDLVAEGLRRVIASPEPEGSQPQEGGPSVHDLMKACCGIVDSGVEDLATNPEHMKAFGRDSLGHR